MDGTNEILLEAKPDTFKAELDVYSDPLPLDLLLYLIQESEIDIENIQISLITEQFIAYVEEHKTELNELSEFYKMAAHLLYIKSQDALPVEIKFDDIYDDPRQELIERLIEYQKFKKYADLLSGTTGNGEINISRKKSSFAIPYSDEELFHDVGLEDLFKTFKDLISKALPINKVFNVFEAVDTKEKIALMLELLEDKEYISFEEIIVNTESVMHIIAAFMAILEATKDHIIIFEQGEDESIRILKRPLDFDPHLASIYDSEADIIADNDLAEDDNFEIIGDDEEDEEIIISEENLDLGEDDE